MMQNNITELLSISFHQFAIKIVSEGVWGPDQRNLPFHKHAPPEAARDETQLTTQGKPHYAVRFVDVFSKARGKYSARQN